MKVQISTTILTLCYSLFVEGVRTDNFRANSRTNYGGRIINGQNADPEDYPFFVQLQRGKNHLCGGSVISDRYILTAAHCVYGDRCLDTKIFPLSSVARNIHQIHIERCFPYALYHPPLFQYDIALILSVERLVTDLKLGAILLPPTLTNYPPGLAGVIAGWGKTENSNFPGRTRYGYVTVQSRESCNTAYRNARVCIGGGRCPVPGISIMSMCTVGGNPRPVGACEGDFGGPLIIEGRLAGVMSGAIMLNGRCKEGSPILHTAVSHFVPWIRHLAAEAGQNII